MYTYTLMTIPLKDLIKTSAKLNPISLYYAKLNK